VKYEQVNTGVFEQVSALQCTGL